MAVLPRRTADASEDHLRPSGGRLPEWGDRLGCGACGQPAQEHGSSVIHRFVRPDLPEGYRYRDELGTGDERALHRRPVEQSTVVVTDLRPVHRAATGRARPEDPRTGAVRAYLNRLRAEPDPQVRLQRGVDLLSTLVPGCHHASVTASATGRSDAHATTDATSRRADRLQLELDAGPSLQALRTGHSVVAHDLGRETRWAGWCATVVHELGVTSVLSVLLTGHGPPATLNLYSDTVRGLSGVDLALVHTLAAPLEVALLGVRFGAGRLGPAA